MYYLWQRGAGRLPRNPGEATVAFVLIGGIIGFIAGVGANRAAEAYALGHGGANLQRGFPAPLASPAGLAFGAIGAAAYGALALRWGLQPATLQFALLVADLLFLSRTDLLVRLIPNGAILFALACRMAFFAWAIPFQPGGREAFLASIAGLVLIGGLMAAAALIARRLRGSAAIGGGDIKLFAVLGFYFGFEAGLAAVLLSCILGLAANALSRRRGEPFPFGPAIALAALIILLV